ncbi:MAG: 4-alpha-glucanotransferase [Syntrophaceae bacterium]|nr:4-alpha-glucanotransferase [Syntrophaceae bacterium]
MHFRGSGILNHVTSLPSPYGTGDLGPAAYRFVDFLAQARQTYWQVLPLNPVHGVFGFSPYSSSSAFAGNTLLISPERLAEEGFLKIKDLPDLLPLDQADFPHARQLREKLFLKVLPSFQKGENFYLFEQFCHNEAHWLDNYALFCVLKESQGGKPWHHWPEELRDRHPDALEKIRTSLHQELDAVKILQCLFFNQWRALKHYARMNQIRLIGDLPLYVAHDSADVWANPSLFYLDDDRKTSLVSGAPAGVFNPKGQRWGHPLYRWEANKEQGYRWWFDRLEHNLALYDRLRLDHFQGFFRFWAIPASAKSALAGHWMPGPGQDFFRQATRRLTQLPLIAEDLGEITPDTRETMAAFEIPGVRPLTFAFGQFMPESPFAPHNLSRNNVVYTGTHDSNSLRGWFETEASRTQKQQLSRYLGRKVTAKTVVAALIQLAMMTVADTVILPLQDVLGLGAEARMNRPGTHKGNWVWRHQQEFLTPEIAVRFAAWTKLYGRC